MPGPSDHSQRKILIVDDQESNVRLLEFALKRGGYTAVSSTIDPRTVTSLQSEHRYDLILLDLRMPAMDGFEVMRALRSTEEGATVPILILSADPSQMVQASEAGANGFLSKPFVLTDVLTCVAGMLDEGAESGS
jgi:CheY-like chemotaxis protein